MGIFGKLFDKKECSICGGEIGLLGNRKLEDGNLCKVCAGKLSPWFDDRRHSTVEQIRQQLAYREENRRNLDNFRPTKSYGEDCELKVEYQNGVPARFVVAKTDNYLQENADIIEFRNVTSFNIDIEEDKEELKRENSQGEQVSYVPPRYEYSYDFYAEIYTTNPYCDDIRFRINGSTLHLETWTRQTRPTFGSRTVNRDFDPAQYPEYRDYTAICEELEVLFRSGMHRVPMAGEQSAPAPVAPQPATAPTAAAGIWRCDACGSENSGKFCESCGAPKPAPNPAAGWICSCGTRNTGKFCQECGNRFGG